MSIKQWSKVLFFFSAILIIFGFFWLGLLILLASLYLIIRKEWE